MLVHYCRERRFALTQDRQERLALSRLGRAWMRWERYVEFRYVRIGEQNDARALVLQEEAAAMEFDYNTALKAFRKLWSYAWERENRRAAKRRSVIGYVSEALRRAVLYWRATCNYKERKSLMREKSFVNEMVLKAKLRYGV